jgi:hypothetical protein
MFGMVVATLGTITSCGGGGDTASPAPGTSQITTGVITGFGSVHVDGVPFVTDATTKRRHLDDGPGDAGSDDRQVFSEGMVVSVHHQPGSNKATKIDFVNNFEGPVSNATATGFTVFGVPVRISANTRIKPAGTVPANGAIAEVSGIADASGAIPATFIELKAAGTKNVFEIKGIVSNLDAVNKTFSIGTVQGATNTVSVSFATAVLDNSMVGGLANGMFAEVKTDLAGSSSSPVKATKVEAGLKSEAEVETEVHKSNS